MLEINKSLIEKLNKKGIKYCHWKSNSNIEKSLSGNTDIDILVNRDDAVLFNDILSDLGYKRSRSQGYIRYPSIEHYFCLDEKSGNLSHLHVHYRLTLGEKFLKGYRLPLENKILANRIKHKRTQMYLSDPTDELLLLLVRYGIKIRFRDKIKSKLGKKYLNDEFWDEYRWLIKQTKAPDVVKLSRENFGSEISAIVFEILEEEPNIHNLWDLKKKLKNNYPYFVSYGPIHSKIRMWWRESICVFDILNSKYFQTPLPLRRSLATGGVTIALVGADGAGKSTITKEISDWCSDVADVQFIYHGTGEGKSSLVRWPLKKFAHIYVSKFKSDNKAQSEVKTASRKRSSNILRGFWDLLWALSTSYERRKKIRKENRAKNKGMVVITDRYPQNSMNNKNDGPLLQHWSDSSSKIKRKISEWESEPYDWVNKSSPEMVIKLDVSLDSASERRPDMNESTLKSKIESIDGLEYNSEKVIKINADKQKDDVIDDVKHVVWNLL